MHTRRNSPSRAGFTLVELMITIGIIAILAGILVVALGAAGGKAREASTASLIKKINAQVQERLENFDRLRSQPQWASDASAFAAGNNMTVNQAKIMLLKYRMKIVLPQTMAELQAVDPAEYTKFTNGFTDRSKHDINTESSELLYYALTSGRVFGIPTTDVAEFRTTEAKDTDGDGLLEFVDAWERPLRFYRWPTRLIKPDGTSIDRTQGATVLISGLPGVPASGIDPLSLDQDDPTLRLLSPPVSIMNETNYHTSQTWHNFLIVSAGPDGGRMGGNNDSFGLYAPTDTANYGHLARPTATGYDALTDNITNRNRP